MAGSAISAITSTDLQYPVLVNGFLCYSAAEVRAARQLINPATLKDDDDSGSSNAANRSASSGSSLRTYTAQGVTEDDEDSKKQRGSLVNLLA